MDYFKCKESAFSLEKQSLIANLLDGAYSCEIHTLYTLCVVKTVRSKSESFFLSMFKIPSRLVILSCVLQGIKTGYFHETLAFAFSSKS